MRSTVQQKHLVRGGISFKHLHGQIRNNLAVWMVNRTHIVSYQTIKSILRGEKSTIRKTNFSLKCQQLRVKLFVFLFALLSALCNGPFVYFAQILLLFALFQCKKIILDIGCNHSVDSAKLCIIFHFVPDKALE